MQGKKINKNTYTLKRKKNVEMQCNLLKHWLPAVGPAVTFSRSQCARACGWLNSPGPTASLIISTRIQLHLQTLLTSSYVAYTICCMVSIKILSKLNNIPHIIISLIDNPTTTEVGKTGGKQHGTTYVEQNVKSLIHLYAVPCCFPTSFPTLVVSS